MRTTAETLFEEWWNIEQGQRMTGSKYLAKKAWMKRTTDFADLEAENVKLRARLAEIARDYIPEEFFEKYGLLADQPKDTP